MNSNVRGAKADYIKEQLRNNEGNSAKFWRSIKQIMPSKKGHKLNNKVSLSDNEELPIQEHKVAEYMNTFFANLGAGNDTFSSGTSNRSETNTLKQNEDLQDNNFTLETVSRFEIELLINKINTSKSSGITSLSSKLLKDSFQVLSDQLVFLFNFSLHTAIFPSEWKKALPSLNLEI